MSNLADVVLAFSKLVAGGKHELEVSKKAADALFNSIFDDDYELGGGQDVKDGTRWIVANGVTFILKVSEPVVANA